MVNEAELLAILAERHFAPCDGSKKPITFTTFSALTKGQPGRVYHEIESRGAAETQRKFNNN